MAAEPALNLEILLSLWPVTSTLSDHLPVGHLIDLARLSSTLRALLHGFELLREASQTEPSVLVREDLKIGNHGTPYWQRLKARAPFECSSRIHTKGSDPKPCRYCSKPICDACIVRDSFAKGHEYTFHNRVRHLCKTCWETGNPSRTQRFPLKPTANDNLPFKAEASAFTTNTSSCYPQKWHDPSGTTRDFCTCTLQVDGILCLECKDIQNHTQWTTRCHGQNCTNTLSPDDQPLRRICQWCDKPLPRQMGGTTRHHWTSKIIEARARHAASRQADMYEYNRKRLAERTMSRRELRGDEAVQDDPEADQPQFVRHLDTLNYRSYMSEAAAPSPDAVFASKRGYWRYSQAFLLAVQSRCRWVQPSPNLTKIKTSHLSSNGLHFAATNRQKADDRWNLSTSLPSMPPSRDTAWSFYKATVLEILLVQKKSYIEARGLMLTDYAFEAEVDEYHDVMDVWTTQEGIREHRRKSLEDEGDAIANKQNHKNKATPSFALDLSDLDGQTIDGADDSGRRDTTTTSTPIGTNDAAEAPPNAPSRPPLFGSTPPPLQDNADEDAPQSIGAHEEPPPYSAGDFEWDLELPGPGEEEGGSGEVTLDQDHGIDTLLL